MSTRSKRSAASAGTHHDMAATPVKIAKLTNGSAVDSKGKQKAGKNSAHAQTEINSVTLFFS